MGTARWEQDSHRQGGDFWEMPSEHTGLAQACCLPGLQDGVPPAPGEGGYLGKRGSRAGSWSPGGTLTVLAQPGLSCGDLNFPSLASWQDCTTVCDVSAHPFSLGACLWHAPSEASWVSPALPQAPTSVHLLASHHPLPCPKVHRLSKCSIPSSRGARVVSVSSCPGPLAAQGPGRRQDGLMAHVPSPESLPLLLRALILRPGFKSCFSH